MMKMHRLLLLLILSAGAGTGCGPELVGGDEHGDAQGVVTDDPSDGTASRRSDGPSMSRSPESTQRALELEGTVTVDARVDLLTHSGAAVPITGNGGIATVSLGAGDRDFLGKRTVEARVYPDVRLTFTRVVVGLAAGVPGPLEVEVDLSTGPLVVEVPVAVEVIEDGLVSVVIDLNSAAWVSLADPVTGLVAREAFSSALEVRAEQTIEN